MLKDVHQVPPPCNCCPTNSPVGGKCYLTGAFYQATLSAQNQEDKKYVGLSEQKFIERYQKHASSFRIHDPRNSTSLSKAVLELQRKHILFDTD